MKNKVIDPCRQKLCVTYVSCDGIRCPDERLEDPPTGNGCVCKEGYGLMAENKCGEMGTCDCPAYAHRRDPRFFENYKCPDL